MPIYLPICDYWMIFDNSVAPSELVAEGYGSIFLLIKWDSNTLEQMPHEVIEANIKDDLDFTEMWLNRNEVELAESRDMPPGICAGRTRG